MKETMMSTRELAEHLGVHMVTVVKWRKSGKGPRFVRVGGKIIRYRWKDVTAWLKAGGG